MNVSEEKEGEKSTQKEMVDMEEIARKKAEQQKKRAEQQKAKENKEREKAVKEKERAALMERDNRIFAEMNSLARNLNVESKRPCINLSDEEEYDVGRAEPMDDDEYFGGRDIISECSSYLHPPPNPHISALNQSPLSPPPPKSAKPALQTPRATVGGKRPRDFTQSQSQLSPRPTVGGKKPRSMFHHSCQKCEEYKEIIATQDQEIAQLKAQVNGCYEELPRPGKVPEIVAARFKMVELSKGRGVYLYEDQINTAKSKNSPTSAACFLLSCFYKNSELVGKNLTGANARKGLNADIVSSILDFVVKQGEKASTIKQALRNKLSSLTTRASGWQPARKVNNLID